MSADNASALEVGAYVAAVVLAVGSCLGDPCDCGQPDCLDPVLGRPEVQGALSHQLTTLATMARGSDTWLATLLGRQAQVDHPAGSDAWVRSCRHALAHLDDAGDNAGDNAEVARLEAELRGMHTLVHALLERLGRRVELTPREVLDAGAPDNLLRTWQDDAKDVRVVTTLPPAIPGEVVT